MWTPLDCAAAKGWVKTARILLEADSPVDPMDKTKVTFQCQPRNIWGDVVVMIVW